MNPGDRLIYPKDIMDYTRKTLRCSQMLFAKIRKVNAWPKSHAITVQEFADYRGIRVVDLLRSIGVDANFERLPKISGQ